MNYVAEYVRKFYIIVMKDRKQQQQTLKNKYRKQKMLFITITKMKLEK